MDAKANRMNNLVIPKFKTFEVTTENEFLEVFPLLKQLAKLEFSEEESAKISSKKSWGQYQLSLKEGYRLYAAKNSSETIAVFGIRIMNDPLNTGKPYAQINNLVVDEDYRNLGIGKELFIRIGSLAKKSGCKDIFLAVLKTNRKGKKFYEKVGFNSPVAEIMLKEI
jgi:GNAT superfamily N-acetyltransferase